MGGDGIERGGLSSKFYMYFDRGRSVSGHLWPDYHLGGPMRGGLGGSDCIRFLFFSSPYCTIKYIPRNLKQIKCVLLAVAQSRRPHDSFNNRQLVGMTDKD